MLFSNSFTIDLFYSIIAIVAAVYGYYKWSFTYWSQRGVKTLPPSIPFGNIGDIVFGRNGFGEVFQENYNYFKQFNLPYGGVYFFTKKFLVLTDPEIIKCVMQKDFQYFINRGNYVNEDIDPLSGNLANLESEKWRKMRVKLTPTFTSGKMKMMFETLANCTTGLCENINKHSENNTPADIKEVLGCFSTDIIGSCAFGIECNTQKNPNSDFRSYSKKFFESTVINALKNFLQFAFPNNFLRFINFKITNQKVEDFFVNLVKETVDYREKNNIFRKDFMHLLIQLKNMGKITDDEQIHTDSVNKDGALDMKQVTAQAFVFFIAGFETSSTTMTFALYEISLNSKVQKKLRQEIQTVFKKYDNKLCYNAIMELHYMDKVINETLRKYPPGTALTRECNRDYKIPGHNLTIEKGTNVVIPVKGLHHDHEYYPNPEVFDPERFNEENKAARPPFTWLPFGEGPRVCIGQRFGMMQTKVGLTTLIKNYEISISRKTSIPLILDPRGLILSTIGGVWLNFKKIEA